MAGHTKKWQQLYKSTMAWQKRARAKERRLRKQGITNVNDLSPVKSAKELQSMSYAELSRYRHELNVFSDRNTRFVQVPTGKAIPEREKIPLASGETITGREWAKLQRAVDRANAPRVNFFESVKSVELRPELEAQREQMMMANINPRTLQVETPAFGESDYGILRSTALPWTRAAYKARLGYARKLAQVGVAETAAKQRDSARKILETYGDDTAETVIEQLDTLSDNQMLTLTQITSFFDDILQGYISAEDYEAGRMSPAEISRSTTIQGKFETVLANIAGVREDVPR